jgi:hypothetical protein
MTTTIDFSNVKFILKDMYVDNQPVFIMQSTNKYQGLFEFVIRNDNKYDLYVWALGRDEKILDTIIGEDRYDHLIVEGVDEI